MKAITRQINENLSCSYTAGEISALTRIIATELLGVSQMAFYLKDDITLTAEQQTLFDNAIERLKKQEPIQYILGYSDFCGLRFKVTPATLIPRPETSELVEWIASEANGNESILDIGTGSGCIPISLGHYGKFENIMAVDISQKALGYATENAVKNNIKIDFYESDLFTNLPAEWKGNLDAIVSNPPYIPKKDIEELMTEVKDFEPMNALDGGEDGLDFYRAIVEQGREWLKDGGWLFFEIGYDQGEDLRNLLQESGYTEVEIRQDLAGLDRVALGRKGA